MNLNDLKNFFGLHEKSFVPNVGIGTTSPGAKLHVMEEMRIGGSTSGYVGLKAPAVAGSGVLTLPATVGTSGQTLVTDGSGILSWSTPSVGGSAFPVALGTSAAPSMNFSGDTNTGIYSPGADNVAISTSGVERLRISDTGAVGIGTTSPSAPLTISTTVETALRLHRQANTYGNLIAFQPAGSILPANPVWFAGIAPNTTSFVFGANSSGGYGTPRMFIDISGNVGIGTTSSPLAKLQIASTGGTDLRIDGSTSGFVGLRAPAVAGSGVLTLPATVGTSGQTLVTDGSGVLSWANAGASGVFPIALGSAATPSMNFSGDTDTGIYSPAADTVAISTSGTESLRVNGSGYVGIGTTTPTRLLDVASASTTATSIGIGNSSAGGRTFTLGSTGSANGIGAGNFYIYDATSTSFRLVMNSSGYVGIGTTNPVHMLQVGDATNSGGTTLFNGDSTNTFVPQIAVRQLSGTAGIGTMVINGSNNRRAGLFVNDTDALWGLSQANTSGGAIPFVIRQQTTGEVLRIDASGYVGIGTTSPGAKLHVMEEVRIGGSTSGYVGLKAPAVAGSGVLTLPATVGTSGQTLVTDGSGVLSWMNGGAAGVFPIALGSAATPSMNFSGDTDTGIYSPGADTVAIATSAAERIRISSTGYVGIGTTAPGANLHVRGTSFLARQGSTTYPNGLVNDSQGLYQYISDSNAIFISEQDENTGATGGYLFFMDDDGTASPNFGIYKKSDSTISNPLMIVKNTGRVGIGTATPASTLDVRVDDAVNSGLTDVLNLYHTTSGTAAAGIGAGLVLGTERADGSQSAAAGIYGVFTGVGTGSGTNGAMGFYTRTDSTTFTEKMRIDTDGKVGIGTTSPTARLEIAGGDLRINGSTSGYVGLRAPAVAGSGILTLPATVGTSGQTLVTDGSGVLTWTASGAAGVFPIALGTSAAPSMNFSGDTDTGIYSPGADTVAIATSAAERIRISSTGYVGIGTSNPSSFLSLGGEVGRAIGVERRITADSAGSALVLSAGGATSGATDKNGGNLDLRSGVPTGTGSSKIIFRSYASGSTGTVDGSMLTAMTIMGDSVGVGTAAPTSRLHLQPANSINTTAAEDVIKITALNVGGGSNIGGRFGIRMAASADETRAAGVYAVSEGNFLSKVGMSFFTSDGGAYSERMRINNSGNVGIGTTNPSYTLDVNGDARATGSVASWSDIRAKKNIQPIDHSLEKILNLEGVTFDWKTEEFADKKFKKGRDIGVIAQNVEKQFPEIVETGKDGYKSVAYQKLVAPLIEAVKSIYIRLVGVEREITSLKETKAEKAEVDAKTANLEAENKKLRKENAEIKARLDKIEKMLQSK